jgi:hypothetical protein
MVSLEDEDPDEDRSDGFPAVTHGTPELQAALYGDRKYDSLTMRKLPMAKGGGAVTYVPSGSSLA